MQTEQNSVRDNSYASRILEEARLREGQEVKDIVVLTQSEEAELEAIEKRISQVERRHYKALQKKLHEAILTSQEDDELVVLSEKMEGVEVDRLERLASIAEARYLSLRVLMNILGMKSPSNA